jgi:Trp operon repressor
MAIEEMAMTWMETDPVSERVRFISAWLSREESVSALSARFGVSRQRINGSAATRPKDHLV